MKKSSFFNDSKRRKIVLSCSKRVISKRVSFSEFHSFFSLQIKFDSHKKAYENKDFCNVIMLSEDNKVLSLINIKNYMYSIYIK